MNFNMIFDYSMPTRIVHGFGAVAETGKEASFLKVTRALLVTDKGVKGAGLIDNVMKSLEASGIPVTVFADVEEDPGTATVVKGLDLLKTQGCNGVVIVGGGSCICAGKGIALLGANGGTLSDYEGSDKFNLPPLPVIGIPTTAGAGSEVSSTFIINDEKRNYKMSVQGKECFPKVAILDPMLLANIPYWPGMNAGMDALSHAVGACCTNLATPITDSLAIAAIAMMVKNLAPAILTTDLEAKNRQLMASVMANIACGNSRLDLVHALSHPLASRHMPHGLANGILVPYVMEFNLPVCADTFAQMAIAMGEAAPGMTVMDLAGSAIELIKELYIATGYPSRIPADVATEKDIPDMVKQAMTRPMIKFNKRKSSEKELTSLYRRAMEGWD
jgi:alcohol dehydrogenase class IV